jgi:arylformamidase
MTELRKTATAQIESLELQPQVSFHASNQFEYIDGQLRPAHTALFEQIAAENDRAFNDGQPRLEIAYGPHPRQTLDLFRTPRGRRATVVYFHAGYWQSRDKSGFSFLAPPLASDGFDVAIINYPLSPDMGVKDIVVAANASLPALAALTKNAPLILVGHSAGAQIAIELGMSAHGADWNVTGVMAISGVFDLAPLIDTSVNEKLALDLVAARAASPLHRVVSGSPRAIFAVGALETRAFRDQTARMSEAWAGAGNETSHMTVPDADHFSVLNELCRDDGMLRAAMRDLDLPRVTS